MDLIGHLMVIEEAGLGNGAKLQKEKIIYAMFPNLAHCHEWAYKGLWDAHRYTDNEEIRLIQGHMICDYVIHYGPNLTDPKQRIGWAYKEMPKAIEQMEPFLNYILDKKFVLMDPRLLDDLSHFQRDFGHTTVECALDFALACKFSGTDRFHTVCEAFKEFGRPDVGEKFIEEVFQKTSGFTREPRDLLLKTIDDYARWATAVKSPVEFAALTLLSKYNIHECKESLEFCVDYLESLSKQLDPSSLDRMLNEIIERIANPEIAINIPRTK